MLEASDVTLYRRVISTVDSARMGLARLTCLKAYQDCHSERISVLGFVFVEIGGRD